MTNQEIINLITSMYMWFNQISDPHISFQKEDLEKYFAPNFIMQLNDEIKTTDYTSLYKHFERFRQSGAIVTIQFPLQEIVIAEDYKKCVVRYTILKKNSDTTLQQIKVIAIWHISQDNRLERMNEVVFWK